MTSVWNSRFEYWDGGSRVSHLRVLTNARTVGVIIRVRRIGRTRNASTPGGGRIIQQIRAISRLLQIHKTLIIRHMRSYRFSRLTNQPESGHHPSWTNYTVLQEMKSSPLLTVLVFNVVTLASALANMTIGMGPFTVSIPDSWSIEKELGESKLQASSPDFKSIGEGKFPVMVRIEKKKKIGATLEDLQEFLTKKISTSPDEGKAMIEKGWGDKADRLAVDALKISKLSILGVAPNRYLISTILSDFDIDGKKQSFIIRSYWVYLEDKAYSVRIVTPIELAEQYAGVIDEIARSVKINKEGEQVVAPNGP